MVPIDILKAADYNPRQAQEKDVDDLHKSIEKYGVVDPIIVNGSKERKNIIIGGHFRVKVAKDMGITEVPVVYVDIPDLKREQELNLRLNKNIGKWDYDLLANFNEEMLMDVGFDGSELDIVFDLETNPEDDFNPEKALEEIKTPKTKRGDIYILGRHRLLCGSSTDSTDMTRLMNGKQADLVFTDPPYNVNYKGRKHDKIMNDDMSEEAFVEFVMGFMTQMKEHLKQGGGFYICSGYSSYPIFLYTIKAVGMNFSTPIIWVKNITSMGWGDYRHKHEMILKGAKKDTGKKKAQPIMYGWNGGRHYFKETRFEADVWEIKRRAGNQMVHPTQKPLELVSRAINNSTERGQIILEQFGGSGSTLISAEQTGRICYAIELDPKYCDVIVARWEKLTGKTAEIEVSNKPKEKKNGKAMGKK
jgi:DNA modification methylase